MSQYEPGPVCGGKPDRAARYLLLTMLKGDRCNDGFDRHAASPDMPGRSQALCAPPAGTGLDNIKPRPAHPADVPYSTQKPGRAAETAELERRIAPSLNDGGSA